MKATITESLETLKRSSHFISGDTGSFKVKFSPTLELPGKDDPGAYMDRLGVKLAARQVFVLFPGNGGLCVEALNRGAAAVLAVEPRESYMRALSAVSQFSSEINSRPFSAVGGASGMAGWKEQFDVVLWSEGLDRLKDPMQSIQNVLTLLKPGGKLYIEVTHGQQEMANPPLNTWLPKEAVFEQAIATTCSEYVVSKLKGRLERRTIYVLTKPEAIVVPQAVAEGFKHDTAIEAIRETADKPTQVEPPKEADEKPKKVSMKKRKG